MACAPFGILTVAVVMHQLRCGVLCMWSHHRDRKRVGGRHRVDTRCLLTRLPECVFLGCAATLQTRDFEPGSW
jgi:hypothetical protein|eukprot:COSAG01_NODE_2515_length_7529_cov_77.394347_8_plen_73_part_00